jgi:bifunctional DNA-binding transcriptional regulator/antitoxin component of YhaV-PrlF toxin-antitoxin module
MVVKDAAMETTKLSSKGQIILPVSIRLANQWQAGVEFAVENTAEGVLLRPLNQLRPRRLMKSLDVPATQARRTASRKWMRRLPRK